MGVWEGDKRKMTKQQEFRKQTEEAKFEAFSFMCKKVVELEKQIGQMSNCLNCEFWKDKKYNVCREIKKLGKIRCTFWKLKEFGN